MRGLIDRSRCDFEEEGLRTIADRSIKLNAIIDAETANLKKYEEQKSAKQAEIDSSLELIEGLKEELGELQEVLEEKTKAVEQVKKTTHKAAKVLDQALKEIAIANDEIEKLALDRSSIYRKCRLEEIRLPLKEGNLKNVPMEEVCVHCLGFGCWTLTNMFRRTCVRKSPWMLTKTRMLHNGQKLWRIMVLRLTSSRLKRMNERKTPPRQLLVTIKK